MNYFSTIDEIQLRLNSSRGHAREIFKKAKKVAEKREYYPMKKYVPNCILNEFYGQEIFTVPQKKSSPTRAQSKPQ